jgi:hypothetical protein
LRLWGIVDKQHRADSVPTFTYSEFGDQDAR